MLKSLARLGIAGIVGIVGVLCALARVAFPAQPTPTPTATPHSDAAYAAHVREYRARVANDPQRPRFHYAPPVFWLNDPNGLIQWKGNYHLFYQWDPDRQTSDSVKLPFGLKSWGHAISHDLLHWEEQPTAIAPTPGGPDWAGVWSGSMVIDQGVPTAIYTGITFDPFGERQCLAVSHDGMRTWEKHPANPVLAHGPQGQPLLSFRDPYVWREGSRWLMALGSGIQNHGPAVLLYQSADLVNWEYRHPLIMGNTARHGVVFECPSFFPLGDRHVLVAKTANGIYFTGTWDGDNFTPQTEGVLDLFGGVTAPQIFIDEQGRRIMIGWLDEARDKAAQREAGWSGLMTLPRVLTLGSDGRLVSNLAEEFKSLRGERRQFGPREVKPGETGLLAGATGDHVELRVIFEPTTATRYGLVLRHAPDGSEQTRLFYDTRTQHLCIDREKSSLDARTTHDMQSGALALAAGEPLELRVVLDGSIVEVYANRRAAGASRIYPTRADSLGLDLFAEGEAVRVRSADLWQLR